MLKSWYSQRYHILLKVEDLGRHVTSTGTYMDFKIKGLFTRCTMKVTWILVKAGIFVLLRRSLKVH